MNIFLITYISVALNISNKTSLFHAVTMFTIVSARKIFVAEFGATFHDLYAYKTLLVGL